MGQVCHRASESKTSYLSSADRIHRDNGVVWQGCKVTGKTWGEILVSEPVGQIGACGPFSFA